MSLPQLTLPKGDLPPLQGELKSCTCVAVAAISEELIHLQKYDEIDPQHIQGVPEEARQA